MICTMCNRDLQDNDFILKQTICYRCTYEIKTTKTGTKTERLRNFCRNCGEEIRFNSTLKQRQRNVFCSQECAEEGQRVKSNNHWTRKLREAVPLYP